MGITFEETDVQQLDRYATHARGPWRSKFRSVVAVSLSLGMVAAVTPAALGAQGAVTCDGEVATIVGTNGNDELVGTAGRDVIVGLGGADRIDGLGGPDLICGNSGRDVISGGNGADTIFGGKGSDVIRGDKGADVIDGGNGHDTLRGNAGPDLLLGQDGRDKLFGGNGPDELRGHSGADQLSGDDGDDKVYGGNGADTVRGGVGADVVAGGLGVDALFGDKGPDELFSGASTGDTVNGGGGWDFINLRPEGQFGLPELPDGDWLLALSYGELEGVNGHSVEGIGMILASSNGRRVVRLEGFVFDQWADAEIRLWAPDGETLERFGDLRSGENQFFERAADVDYGRFTSLEIYSPVTGEVFAVTDLVPQYRF